MTDEYVEKVRQKTDIAKIVRNNKCYKCGSELTVSREKQMYYCFNCKEGGNVFTYLLATTGKNMKEIVTDLDK